MVFYYAFDREMLNANGFSLLDPKSQSAIETLIENELKMLIFVMPLSERILISPSFRFESKICREILKRNRAFTESGVIVEYRRESDIQDFWLKKNDAYRSAMEISEDYRNAYDQESTYRDAAAMWIDHIPKQKAIGQVSRDVFMENTQKRGIVSGIATDQVDDVLKITHETREDTFLWERERHMLKKYGVSDEVIRRLGVRDSMNLSYLDVFADQGIDICQSILGIAKPDNTNPVYDMWRIKSILEREGIKNNIISLSSESILEIRANPELQDLLDIIRNGLAKGDSDTDIHIRIKASGNIQTLIAKLIIHPLGGKQMNTSEIISEEKNVLQENTLRILHLSDLHFTELNAMQEHYFYLRLDLKSNFRISKIDYLIISGDVSDRPNEHMYNVALLFVQHLMRDFDISSDHIIITPGNHDCDRSISQEAYNKDEDIIVDQEKYNNRYIGYSRYFYEPIKGRPYPMTIEEQFEDYIFNEDNLCILGLSSCGQIDHKYTERSSISMKAIQKSETIWCDNTIKLAVWHHPLIGWAAIQDTTFMDTLAVAGFKACFHGHIHEAKNDLFAYDVHRSIRMIGAGTFGSVQAERGDGIPRQYNLVELDKTNRHLIVHTRKREKDNGMWQADARWEDKNHNPKSFYTIKL